MGEGNQPVGDGEDGIAGHQGGGVAVGTQPQVDQVEVLR
jgi:hypothetical protein